MYLKKILLNLFILLIISSLCLFPSCASCASSRLINFQGRLTDQQGNPLDGTYDIKFSIYTSDPNSAPLWTEEYTDVSVSNGIINVLLGGITSFDEPFNVTFDEERFLGIAIDCDHDPNTEDPEMTPRQRILPSIYSYNADKLDGKDSSEYTTPQTDAGRPGVVENLYEGNIRLMDKYIKQSDLGNKGCYISYSGPNCLEGFTNKGSLGDYGVCQGVHIYLGSPGNKQTIAQMSLSLPGANCGDLNDYYASGKENYYTEKVVWGTAYLCCQ